MSSACGGGSTEPAFRVTGRGSAVAGDALALAVVDRDGAALGSDVAVTWRLPATVSALSPDATDPADPLPVPGAAPTGVFVVNPSRGDVASTIADVLFVLDAGSAGRGSLVVTADLSTGDSVAAEIEVSAAPTGDATRGQSVYGANCARCHGNTGDGTDANADGTFTIAGSNYLFPAPGLNNAPDTGNLGGDPDWTAALLAFAARCDADNGALALRDPMPNWLTTPDAASGSALSTQDFADVYAYLTSEAQ